MDFSIGLSGLRAAEQAISLIGTNIANATTEGYHRQELRLSPIEIGRKPDITLGGAERSVFELAAALRQLGINITILAAKGQTTAKKVLALCDHGKSKRT